MADTAPANPAPICIEGYRSLEPWWIVKGSGPLAGFQLRLDKETYSKGDSLIAILRNVTSQGQSAGIKAKYDIQYRGSNGWHTIIGVKKDEDFGWTDEGYLIPPENGWTWRLTLTATGIWDGEYRCQSYHACQPLKPGTYRFVYWGVGDSDDALGTTFTVIEG